MKVNDLIKSIRAIHKANIENYENSLDAAILYRRKIKECEKQLEELSLNAYKKYKDMKISVNECNKIIESITNITI